METSVSELEISEVPLRDDTPLSSREMYRLSQRIVVDWERLAGLMNITRAERDEIRYSLLYSDSRSRAEKVLSIFNRREDFSREKTGCLFRRNSTVRVGGTSYNREVEKIVPSQKLLDNLQFAL